MFEVGKEFIGTVSALAFGGLGIIRSEGFVIFVPFTAPGDRLKGVITVRKPRHAIGKLVELIQPGPNRIAPLCPYFGVCGGCQLQHLNPASQLAYKKEAVADALKHIGHLSTFPLDDVVPSAEPWAYRRHIRLHLRAENGSFQAGYIGADNRTLLPVRQCPIFISSNDPVLSNLQQILSKVQAEPGDKGELTLIKREDGRYLLAFSFEKIPSSLENALNTAAGDRLNWAGITVRSFEKTLQWGNTEAVINVEGLQFHFSPFAFIQNHPVQSVNIYRAIMEIASRSNPFRILDLYCGIGISTLLLGQMGFSVTGVEASPIAIQLARENGLHNGISKARFEQADVGTVLGRLLKKEKPELIIINPPRAGLEKNVVNLLIESQAMHLVYVSCMPSTLSRDLEWLCKEKYGLQKIRPYDMFPQTAHVETLVHLQLTEF